MTIFPNGNYQIFSTVFEGQVADLWDGKPNGLIVGFHNGTEAGSVWGLSNVGYRGNQFTLQNQAPTANGAFAGLQDEVEVGAQLHGSPNAITWTAIATCIPGQFMLLAPMTRESEVPSGLVWTLDSGADKTPISLEFMGSGSSDDDPDYLYARAPVSQAWNFIPFR